MYGTREDIPLDEDRLVELTDTREAPGAVDWTAVDQARGDANAMIEQPLRDKYVLPLDPIDAIVRVWWRAIVAYLLYRRREKMPMPATTEADFKRTIQEIRRVADGADQLSARRAGAATPPNVGGGALDDLSPVFGRGRDGLF